MDVLYFIMLLILIYLINPLKGEEKITTTPFLTVSYIIVLSYILSILNIPMYKLLYLIPLAPLFIYKLKKRQLHLNVSYTHNKKSYVCLGVIIIYALFVGYMIFPSNPANTTDTQFHSYKSKAMIEEKTIFYKTNEIPYNHYIHYPAGFHSMVYFLSSSVSDILNSIQFMKFYILILFVLGYYLVGNEFKKNMGLWTALFLPITNIVYRVMGVLLPNFLGYAMMLIAFYFVLKYRKTNDHTYLILFSFTTMSLIYTHTFPIIILTLLLVSLFTYDIFSKNYKKIMYYLSSYIASLIIAVMLIINRMMNKIVSYGKSKNFTPEPLSNILHNILAGLGIGCLYVKSSMVVDNTSTFIISLILSFLLMLGIYHLLKNKDGIPFIMLLILLILNIVNIKFIHIPIPFFSSQYDTVRMAMHIQVIMPLFYGAGCCYIWDRIRAPKYKNIFLIFIILFAMFSSFTNYTIISRVQMEYYVIDNNDLKIFEYMNTHNITNETILNFGEDAGQFLPIYTKNKPVFYYYKFQCHNATVGGYGFGNITTAVDNNNYSLILDACKKEHIKYIFMNNYLGQYDHGFFENDTYFEILCKEGNAKLVKIK